MLVIDRDSFVPLRPGETGFDESLIVYRHAGETSARNLILFVHGLNGARYETWGNMPRFLYEDCTSFDLGLYDYASGARRVKISQSNSLESLSEQLADLVRDLGYQRVALIGHSMGGLLCQNTIKSLIDSRTRDVDGTLAARRIAGLFLMATPQAGSLRTPRFLRHFSKDARVLTAHSAFVTTVQQRFSDVVQSSAAAGVSPDKFFIPTYAMVATNDKWVDDLSSRLGLSRDHIKIVRGTHTSLIKPTSREDDGYQWFLPRLRSVMDSDLFRGASTPQNFSTRQKLAIDMIVPASLGSEYLAEVLGPLGHLPFETQIRVTIDASDREDRDHD